MKIPVAREVIPFFIPTVLITVILFFLHPCLGLAGIILCGYFIYFFRDPSRDIPEGTKLILSPADGKVVDIERVNTVPHTPDIKGSFWKISIFLNIFNVHVTYAPLSGSVQSVHYKRGRCLPANMKQSSMVNENNIICILSDNGYNVIVRQIAGILARRVVCDCKPGDTVNIGQRIGIIKFSSRVEVYFPAKCQLAINKGDIVKGKLSILGVLDS